MEKLNANLFWFLPTYGDGAYLGSNIGARKITLEYLTQVAKAAEYAGFLGALIPTGRSCEESYIVGSALFNATKAFRFLMALRPGVISPSFAARISATLDRLSGGRTLFNLVTGGDEEDLQADGIFLNHKDRYEQAAEFTKIWKALLSGECVNFKGKYYNIKDAKLFHPPLQTPYPPLFFGGSSEIAHKLAGEYVDKYLSWGEIPSKMKEKIDAVKAEAAKHEREVTFGARFHIIVRESEEEAWEAARKLISKLDEKTIKQARKDMNSYVSVGQQRMNALFENINDDLVIYPNIWAGVGLVRAGAGTAIVGSVESVLRVLKEYIDIGVDTFVLSGYPHLEEALRVGDLLMPYINPVGLGEIKLKEITKKYDTIANRSQ
ncbi:alkanesulfonate monooxygenase [Helicobacter turcicus]|uniref:Alkanesulfonate monooxygenase n=1 Tax=Helicobacter turcicus TaxID=2867412 RepID=A0ABS7JNL1_9HELI|nr:alkanesulfonate monooxygenase [Helicobacter turcicus]MBX7490990.1 alkanesulfonate monooxygenase [Helicobacter turcicus]MBX7545883.1 alkanesulfonate monooxygenase [Helicobacter turcicus]